MCYNSNTLQVEGRTLIDFSTVGPTLWVTTKDHLETLIEAIRGASEVVYDMETTGLDEHAVTGGRSNGGVAARASMAGFTLPQADVDGRWDGLVPVTYVLPLSHPHSPWSGVWRKVLTMVFQRVVKFDKYVVGHHLKFDNRWVYSLTGIDLSDRVSWDTQLSSTLLDENSSARLEYRAAQMFNVDEWGEDINLTYPGASEDVDLMTLGDYQAKDTWFTWALKVAHREMLRLDGDLALEPPNSPEEAADGNLGRLATWVAMPTVATLTKVEQRGLGLDQEWTQERLEEELATAEEVKDEISQRWAMDRENASLHATSKWFKELVGKAVEAGELRITETTPTGAPKWSKSVLEKQARQGSVTAQQILAGRNSAKRAEFLTSWLDKVTPSGLIHANYNVGGTTTGRLSSSGPNMQQVTASLKPAFKPRAGYVLSEIDYSQIELRVAAHISKCEPMIEAFNEGLDLHRLLGARIANKPLEEVTADERQKAKSANFGLLYGMGAAGFQLYASAAYGVELTEEEAFEIHALFFDQWKGMREWHQRMAALVGRHGEVISPIGRIRRLPGAFSGNPRDVAQAERQAANSPVQGFASDLMQLAASSISGTLPGVQPVKGAHVVGTVHDSIMVELEEDNWRDPLRECLDRMTNDVLRHVKRLGCDLTVPLAADSIVGTRWGLEDIKTEDQEI